MRCDPCKELINVCMKEADLFPLRDSMFEDRPVRIPYNYVELLQAEYGKKSLTRTRFAGYAVHSHISHDLLTNP